VRYAVFSLVALLLCGALYIRFAPADPARWHVAAEPKPPGDYPLPGGFEAVRALDRPAAEVLAAAERVILATPRTRRLAGTAAAGRITYVTRSRVWGFPDYTTIWTYDALAPRLAIRGRLRFGQHDFGVNRARIEAWLAELGLGA